MPHQQPPHPAHTNVLVADIGGTNCRFQVWQLDQYFRPSRLVVEEFYATRDYPRFQQALGAFLGHLVAGGGAKPKTAAFACAGPVKNSVCTMTNLGWTVDAAEVEHQFGMRATVLNDFEAAGYGVPALTDGDVLPLNTAARAEDKGPKALLGPGTGLGEAQLFWDEGAGNYRVHASEGSHAAFAPRGWKQRALQAHVEQERGHCSVERVACGSGLVRIYDFLRSNNQSHQASKKESTPACVTAAALDESDPVAVEALDMFLSIVGAEAGYMALRSLASGGVYICGGILPKVLKRVKESGALLDSFLWRESRFHDKALKDIPLFVVTEEKLGLLGTREQAIRLAQEASAMASAMACVDTACAAAAS